MRGWRSDWYVGLSSCGILCRSQITSTVTHDVAVTHAKVTCGYLCFFSLDVCVCEHSMLVFFMHTNILLCDNKLNHSL